MPRTSSSIQGRNETVTSTDTITVTPRVRRGTRVTYRAEFEFDGVARFLEPLLRLPDQRRLGDRSRARPCAQALDAAPPSLAGRPTRRFEQMFESAPHPVYGSFTIGAAPSSTDGGADASSASSTIRAEENRMARASDSEESAVHELPDGPADAVGLTPRQRRVLSVIRDSVESARLSAQHARDRRRRRA